MSLAAIDLGRIIVNLIDTPGYPDFVGELRAGLRAADAAVFVVSATDGLDAATTLLWHECAAVNMPRAVVVTRLDAQRADVDATIAACREVLGDGVLPLYLPVHGAGGAVTGNVGILSRQLYDYTSGSRVVSDIDETRAAEIDGPRSELIEAIITESEDDGLLDRYLGGEDVDLDVVVADLLTAVAKGTLYPLVPVSTDTGVGIKELFYLIAAAFPPPTRHPLPNVTTIHGVALEPLRCDAGGPVGRRGRPDRIGRLRRPALGRPGVPRHPDPGHRRAHLGPLVGLRGPRYRRPSRARRRRAGGRAVVAARRRAAAARSGRRRGHLRGRQARPRGDVGHPQRQRHSAGDRALGAAGGAAAGGDRAAHQVRRGQDGPRARSGSPPRIRSMRLEHNPQTHQVVLWTMGQAHVDMLLARLSDRFGVSVDTEDVKVPLRETFSVPAQGHGRHVKQSGGHGQYAVCDITVEPLPRGSGFEFVDKVVGGSVPRQFISECRKGRAGPDRTRLPRRAFRWSTCG